MFNISLVFMPTFCVSCSTNRNWYLRDFNARYKFSIRTCQFHSTFLSMDMAQEKCHCIFGRCDFIAFTIGFLHIFLFFVFGLKFYYYDCSIATVFRSITAIITIRSDICSICCCHRRPLITNKWILNPLLLVFCEIDFNAISMYFTIHRASKLVQFKSIKYSNRLT